MITFINGSKNHILYYLLINFAYKKSSIMNYRFIKIFIVLFFNLTLHAQNFGWAKQFESDVSSNPRSITTDNSGNVYTTGTFAGTVDFDPGIGTYTLTSNSSGQDDIYISKLDALGSFVWAKQITSINSKGVSSLLIDSSGDIYFTGTFEGTVDFNPGPATYTLSSSFSDYFICKLDNSGNFVWAKQIKSPDMIICCATLDINNNIYISGQHTPNTDLDPGTGVFNFSSNGSFICKLNSSGNFIWAKEFPSITPTSLSNSVCSDIKTDINNNIYITGYFYNDMDCDPSAGTYSLTSNGSTDIFIIKLNPLGNFVWAKQIGGSYNDSPSSISISNLGNVYTSGIFNAICDFDPGSGVYPLSSMSSYNASFISKLDLNGNFVWAKAFTCPDYSATTKTIIDANENLYSCGWFNSTITFNLTSGNQSLTSVGGSDVFIIKLDSAGNKKWIQQIGDSGDDSASPLAKDIFGNVFTSGLFSGTVDFNASNMNNFLTSAGNSDIFVYKLDTANILTGINNNLLKSYNTIIYPNPTIGNLEVIFNNKHTSGTVIIRNVIGQVIYTENFLQKDVLTLFINEIPGIYFLEVLTETGEKNNFKIIKE